MIEIEWLREELADVRADAALLCAEIERLKADIKQAESNGIEFELQRDKALATIDRLRSALTEIAAHDDQFSSPQQARAMRDAARRALEQKL